jgi:sortase A
MKVLVRRGPLNGILQWGQRLFFASAILLWGYCAFVALDAWVFQRQESRILRELLGNHQDAGAGSLQLKPATSTPGPPAVASSGLIGRIEIPRLGISVIVMEGVSSKTLRRAVGHIPGTALPGEPGNVGISGHRDTFFRPLRNIRQDDIITLTTLLGEYRYRVVSTKVVGPYDVAVLDPGKNQILTLVTCYPFYLVGSAPDRFIVRAERIT